MTLRTKLIKTKLAVFTRPTMPKSTTVVPKQTNLPLTKTNFPSLEDVSINKTDGRIIADAYDALKHNPKDPAVKESYDALINETKAQFKELRDNGLKIDPITSNMNAYKNSDEMHRDIQNNKHIYFFPTEKGFGSTESGKVPLDHPMLQPSGVKINGEELLNNDVFRIVHDVNGHFRGEASGFGPRGEQQAFLTHRQMFSYKAIRALFTETAGQNNWVNFSRKFGDKNRADPKNTVFAEQKAGLFPDEIVFGKWHQPKNKAAKIEDFDRIKDAAGVPKNQEVGKLRQAIKDFRKKKKGRAIKKISVKKGMMQTARMISADGIIDNFIKSKLNIKGKSGVFDPVQGTLLDATKPSDAIRLQNLFESGKNNIGFNSITDTKMRTAPETNIENIRKQLRQIEAEGGRPALGFDEGSLEALNVSIRPTDKQIMDDLLDNQFSTGILDKNLDFRIVEKPRQ